MVRLRLPLPGAIRLIGIAVRVSCHLGGRRLGEQGIDRKCCRSQHRQPLGAWRTSRLLDSTPLTTSTTHNRLVHRLCNIAQPIGMKMSGQKVHNGRTPPVRMATWLSQRRVFAATSKSTNVAVLACHAIICKVAYPSAFSAPIPRLATSQSN